jgi:hypothetical protein
MEAVFCDSVSPAICMNPDCDHVCEMEPDQTEGWCDGVCRTNTMMAAPILAGLIYGGSHGDQCSIRPHATHPGTQRHVPANVSFAAFTPIRPADAGRPPPSRGTCSPLGASPKTGR